LFVVLVVENFTFMVRDLRSVLEAKIPCYNAKLVKLHYVTTAVVLGIFMYRYAF